MEVLRSLKAQERSAVSFVTGSIQLLGEGYPGVRDFGVGSDDAVGPEPAGEFDGGNAVIATFFGRCLSPTLGRRASRSG